MAPATETIRSRGEPAGLLAKSGDSASSSSDGCRASSGTTKFRSSACVVGARTPTQVTTMFGRRRVRSEPLISCH
eukprot:4694124-Prymnesium_polylepis.1